jgi:hypothetical protein
MTPLSEGSALRRGLYLNNAQHSQETDIHTLGVTGTRNPGKRAAAELHLSLRGHRGLAQFLILRSCSTTEMYSGDTVSNLVGTMNILCEGFWLLVCVSPGRFR